MQEKNKEYNEKEQQIAENRSRNTLFERRENLQKHESYASERRQYDAIRNGQTDRIQSVFQITPDGTPGILSRNELRNSKNMFIAGITLFTRAAIEGGVPEETAYALSDGYIQTVEECTSKSSIEKLSQKAALRFAQEVQKSGMRHYSREIEAAVKYIHLHLHVPVTLEETAEAAGISASYLSRWLKMLSEPFTKSSSDNAMSIYNLLTQRSMIDFYLEFKLSPMHCYLKESQMAVRYTFVCSILILHIR